MLAAGGLAQGTYTNPILHADYSDPDLIRVGGDFYMVSSSFNHVPGLPVLHSRDLLHWEIIGHALPRLPAAAYDRPQHGRGVWAPGIRYHAGEYWIYYGDPDLGLFMVKAKDPAGPWTPPLLVREAKGWIDPCPLWDDDGRAYLVHAWAKSRAGFNSILTVHRMSPDGTRILDEGVTVFDGHESHPTIEGPKFYKREGWYYIFAPAGGVKTGWQTVLRSASVYGPYEARIVLAQGSTGVNGPHQGGWVETPDGESWFIHFQDRGAWGRILHLQPVRWREGWPLMGVDPDGDGIGEPVLRHPAPALPPFAAAIPASDEFAGPAMGLQWQWQANIDSAWYSLTEAPGFLRLYALPAPDSTGSLWALPNLVAQKFPSGSFTATVRMTCSSLKPGERAGLVIFGTDYACLTLGTQAEGALLRLSIRRAADAGGEERVEAEAPLPSTPVSLRVEVAPGGLCTFSFSTDGEHFNPVGGPFTAAAGKWVGAKVGLFAAGAAGGLQPCGYADFDYIHVKVNE